MVLPAPFLRMVHLRCCLQSVVQSLAWHLSPCPSSIRQLSSPHLSDLQDLTKGHSCAESFTFSGVASYLCSLSYGVAL